MRCLVINLVDPSIGTNRFRQQFMQSSLSTVPEQGCKSVTKLISNQAGRPPGIGSIGNTMRAKILFEACKA